MVVVLPPSEYQGEPNTAVGGRVVLRRKFALERAPGKGSKGKGKGKEKNNTSANEKCEVYLLGGQGMQEMLFIEAWGLAAEAFRALAADQRLVQIQNPKVISVRPTYSTSKLHYYLKIEGPVGVATLVQELASEGVWATIPMHQSVCRCRCYAEGHRHLELLRARQSHISARCPGPPDRIW